MRRVAAKLVGLILALGISAPAFCAAIKSVAGKRGSIIIEVSGGIVTGDGEAFIAALQKAAATGKPIESVQLNSAGGNLGEGAKLATAIKLAKLPTVVPSGAVCASACFLAFAAGEQNSLRVRARSSGFPRMPIRAVWKPKQSNAATALVAQFAKEVSVSSSVIARMVATP